MASSVTNTASKVLDENPVEEPSMEDILASIKQIIADDEAPDDGLSERDRYTHPTDHSNTNDATAELDADFQAEMEAEIEAAISSESLDQQPANEADVEQTSADTEVAVEPEQSDAPATPNVPTTVAAPTMEERAAQIRNEISSQASGLTSDQRLEKFRVRGKLQMETLADNKANDPAPAAQSAPEPVVVAPAIAAGPILPTTNAIAQEMAATMMKEKSSEIQTMVSELMRPTIRQWLSDNLPSMVEKLVREEIERVSRGKQAS